MIHPWFIAIAALATFQTHAVPVGDPTPAVAVDPDVGVPVFAYDIADRPYRILGEIAVATNRAGRLFAKEASQAQIYRNLWKKARNMGADAVINARYGDSHVSAFSFGKTNATGTAIRFLAPGEAAPLPQ